MSGAEDNLALAQAQARDARARFDETLGALRDRIDPRTIARNAAEGLREQGEAAADAARRNPGIAAAAATAAGLLIVRRPLLALFRGKKKPHHSRPHNSRKDAKGSSQ